MSPSRSKAVLSTRRQSRIAQLELPLGSNWGGSRPGAGRPPRPGRGLVPHRARPAHCARHPVHVTLRSVCRSLRTQYVFPTVRAAVSAANHRAPEHFRVVEFSVQADHIHLLVEAHDKAALVEGLRGLCIRIARGVNRLTFRRGRCFVGRWHGRALETPRAVRRALVYVLANHRKHRASNAANLDPYSSAPYFRGFRQLFGATPLSLDPNLIPRALAPPATAPVARARTWLLSAGWQRLGRISVAERPARSAA